MKPCRRKSTRWYACAARSVPGGPSQASRAPKAAAKALQKTASRDTAGLQLIRAQTLRAEHKKPLEPRMQLRRARVPASPPPASLSLRRPDRAYPGANDAGAYL